jgi:hypothetical protein
MNAAVIASCAARSTWPHTMGTIRALSGAVHDADVPGYVITS